MSKKDEIIETPSSEHGECCEECKKTCKRNFWTTVLQTIIKVGTAVLAAFGLAKTHPIPPCEGGGLPPFE